MASMRTAKERHDESGGGDASGYPRSLVSRGPVESCERAAPLVGGTFHQTWPLSAVVWTALFEAAAAVLFRRDTRRV